MTDPDRTEPLTDLPGGGSALYDATDRISRADTAAGLDSPAVAPMRGPRTRWGGIVWGLAFAALAVGGIWLASGAGRVDALAAWMRQLPTGTAVGYGILAIGGLLLVVGMVGLLRRAQRALAERRSG
jgi:hypothetical protein